MAKPAITVKSTSKEAHARTMIKKERIERELVMHCDKALARRNSYADRKELRRQARLDRQAV